MYVLPGDLDFGRWCVFAVVGRRIEVIANGRIASLQSITKPRNNLCCAIARAWEARRAIRRATPQRAQPMSQAM